MKSVLIGLFVMCVIQGIHSDDTIESITNYRLPQQRESFIQIIEKIAKQAIQLATDAVKVIQTRIEQIFQQVYDQIFGIQQDADNVLDTILNDFEKLYETHRNDVNSCVQAHADEVKNVISKGREDISKCMTTTMAEVNNIRQSLMPYVESIGNLIQNITGVVDKCSAGSNSISIAICITQHVTDVSNAISGIIHDSQEAIKLASVQIYALALNTRGCVKTSLDAVKNDVEKILAVIKECIANKP